MTDITLKVAGRKSLPGHGALSAGRPLEKPRESYVFMEGGRASLRAGTTLGGGHWRGALGVSLLPEPVFYSKNHGFRLPRIPVLGLRKFCTKTMLA